MSALPKQVQRQAEEAKRLEDELAQSQTPPPADPPTDPNPPQDPPADPSANQEPKVEPKPPADPQTPPQSKDADPNSETWQKRYRDLQGKYNAEVPRLAQQLREQNANLEALNAKLKELSEKPATPAPAASKGTLVTDKDIETFGGDLVDLIKRQAQEIVSDRESALTEKLTKVEAENATLRQQIGNVSDRVVVNDRRSYLTELKKSVPNWEAVNGNDAFIEWLSEVDPLTGFQRQAYLTDAFEKFDVERTAHIFDSWKAMVGFDAPPPPAAPPAPPKNLERQVAPSGSRASNTPSGDSPDQKIWSDTEIRQFHTECIQGKYRGKDAERVRIESEIDLAIAQGRYRP